MDGPSVPMSFSRSATVFHEGTQHHEYCFLAVLGLAQRLNINFLPITWQAALGSVGEGGQSKISQALVNLLSSFAFKRLKGNSQDHMSHHTPFKDIVSEMMALSHPSIRNHPHIVGLHGMCWDIPEDDQVWPVLVFQKANLGDLYQFMKSPGGQKSSVEDRLKLCANIGIAIRDMHSASKERHRHLLYPYLIQS